MEQKTTPVSSNSGRKSRKTKDVSGVRSEIVSASSGRKSDKLKTKKVKSEPATSRPVDVIPSVEPELEFIVKRELEPDISQSEDEEVREVTISTSEAEAEAHLKFVTTFSHLLAEDMWETAWEICETRFFHTTASQATVSDLRDTWLSIVEMQWLDSDPITLEKVKFPTYEDSLPHPPKFDFWSHGALEVMPRTCRESVMDPFIREALPWFMEKFEQERQQLKSAKSSILHVANSEDETLEPSQTMQLVRPTSPIPPTSDEGENTESLWSIASTRGSGANSIKIGDIESGMTSLANSTKSSLAYESRQQSIIKPRSIELIYPSNIPKAEIRASSEIAYRNGGGSSGFMKYGDGLNRESEIVAFKLPQQTSVESVQAHYERKSRKPVKSCSSSDN